VNIGWVGLGKLGLPCALALANRGGHKVTGYDVTDWPWKVLRGEVRPPKEEGLEELAQAGYLFHAPSVDVLVQESDVVFVAVQTPHAPEYGGEKPAPGQPADFEYGFLAQACREVCAAALAQRKEITLVVVSTVLPGTTNRLIRPLLSQYTRLVYSPQFIAMGTTIADFCDPEFVICGTEDPGAASVLHDVFAPLHKGDRLAVTSIENAEAIKVLYNTWISTKVAWGNTVMELCHKTGADCDVVVGALAQATDRVISPRYMSGGMGDGGACHPRDLIAMAALGERLDLSFNLFAHLAWARENQTAWLAELVKHYADLTGLKVIIFGTAYKPDSELTAGSPALLLKHYLTELGVEVTRHIDPVAGRTAMPPVTSFTRAVFIIATAHEQFFGWPYPAGSVVIDPFGRLPDQPGLTVVRVGRK
jgi:UDPglucose 6-dehydrogenase